MRKFSWLLAVVAIFLGGCVAHLSQQQCLTMNWYQEGFHDGAAGQQQRSLQGSIQDCAKFKLKVDQSGYRKGWRSGVRQYCSPTYQMGVTDGQQGKPLEVILGRQPFCQQAGITLRTKSYKQGRLVGLSKFCTYDDGYNIGFQGNPAPQVCPGALRHQFMRGWRAGVNRYCSRPIVAFNMGKAGQGYPQICTPAYYPRFRSEYNRGMVIHNRIVSLQNQINDVNNQINRIVDRWHFHHDGGGYHYGHQDKKHSHEARRDFSLIHRLLARRDRLQNELFQAKSMR